MAPSPVSGRTCKSRRCTVAKALLPASGQACKHQGSKRSAAVLAASVDKVMHSAVGGAASSSELATSSADGRQSTVITYGSDCSGLGTDSIAIHRAALPDQSLKNEFACESSPFARRVLRHGKCRPALLFRDLKSAGRQKAGSVDVYTAGPPCQPYSVAGNNAGEADSRCMLSRVVSYIREKQPKLFVIENVKNLLSKRHKVTWNKMLGELKSIQSGSGVAYNIRFKVLNSKHFGLPQNRERVYVVGCHRSVASGKFHWPTPMETPSLASFLDEHPVADTKKLSNTNLRNIDAALGQAKAAGLDPSSVNVVVDIGCSAS